MKRWSLLLSLVMAVLFAPLAIADDFGPINAALKVGDYKGAERISRDFIADHPLNAKAHYMLAKALVQEDQLKAAMDELAEAQRLDIQEHPHDAKGMFTNTIGFALTQHDVQARLLEEMDHPPRQLTPAQVFPVPDHPAAVQLPAEYIPPVTSSPFAILVLVVIGALATGGLVMLLMMVFSRKKKPEVDMATRYAPLDYGPTTTQR
jgi:hypothetical protein